jgi:preprotein translocase subunit Sec61beta
MAKTKKAKTPPLMSSAGIMRYFEEENTQIKLNPKSVVVFGIVIGVLIFALNLYYKIPTQ